MALQSAVSPPAPVAAPFLMRVGKTHVEVLATDRSLGMRELLQVMRRNANLAKCVIESCSFDGRLFQALLRFEA